MHKDFFCSTPQLSGNRERKKSPIKDCYVKQDCILNAPLEERVFLFANKTHSTSCCSSSLDMQIKELRVYLYTHILHLRYLTFEIRIIIRKDVTSPTTDSLETILMNIDKHMQRSEELDI